MKYIVVLLLALSALLAGCTERQTTQSSTPLPSNGNLEQTSLQDSGEIIPLTNYTLKGNEDGFYSIHTLPDANIIAYTDLNTATQSIFSYDSSDNESYVQDIIPSRDANLLFVARYADGRRFIEAVDVATLTSKVIFDTQDSVFWWVAMDDNSLYLTTVPGEIDEQQGLIRVTFEGEVTPLANLDISKYLNGQDIHAYELYPINNIFYASISDYMDNQILVKRVDEDGKIADVATLPYTSDGMSMSGFFGDGYYQILSDNTVLQLNLTSGELMNYGSITTESSLGYTRGITDTLLHSSQQVGEEYKDVLVELSTLTLYNSKLSYSYERPGENAREIYVKPFAEIGDNLLVVNGSQPVSQTITGADGNSQHAIYMFDSIALISKQDYHAGNANYTQVDNSNILSIFNS